nr:unnamed protein product [Callosobruchus chinensis]
MQYREGQFDSSVTRL